MSLESDCSRLAARAVTGYVFAHLRARTRLSQTELAQRAGLTQSFVSRMERGRAEPNLSEAGRLAEALAVDGGAPALLALIGSTLARTKELAQRALRTEGDVWGVLVPAAGVPGVGALATLALIGLLPPKATT